MWLALGIGLIAAVLLLGLAVPRVVTVMPWQVALVYRGGRFERVLAPGRHWLFGFERRTVERVVAIAQATTLAPAELFARDGFGFRATLALTWRVADPRGWWEATAATPYLPGVRLPGFEEAAQAALLAAAATRPLAETLADPQPLAAAVQAALAGRYASVEIESSTVTRITLPPEVRRLQTEVEAARLTGLAALERARGEQAALRSLANAARLVRDNPELGQLRLLQAIESARKPPTIVLGQPGMTAAGPVAVPSSPDG